MSTQKKSIAVTLLVLAALGLAAQSTTTLVLEAQGVRFSEPLAPANVPVTKVVGQVLDMSQKPVAFVPVQLRNLQDGTVQQESETDENGEYAFSVEPGTYVVEMITANGKVIGLSNAGSLGRSETLRTVVRLPGLWEGARGMVMPKKASTFLGMSAAMTMTAQTVQMALERRVRPVDAGEPVSPYKP